MGSAQSQSSRIQRGSVAHPAVSPTVKISAISVANFMSRLLGGMHGTDAGIGASDRELRLGLEAALADQNPDRDGDGAGQPGPKGDAAADAGEEGGDHAGFPA